MAFLRGERYDVVRFEPDVLPGTAFVICDSIDVQHAACRAQRPSLLLDAREPFTAYPVPPDSLFTLATAVDLDSGRVLSVPEQLTERYFRNTRNCGYRRSSAADVLAAVREMVDGLRQGWTDSGAQARFRRAVQDAGVALGPRVRHIAEWDAASGYVGDGRLARVQAERAS